ncbi:purine permease-related family protein [Striga asiatica]|uniref:Probable purine permease n=1 Tax=Striga asiatica TaxID=4170 RepID=A0A5A7QSQ5_STRAF|nr:purine permease-related family protein [Striga asiatica]
MRQPLLMSELEDPPPKSLREKCSALLASARAALQAKPISHWILLTLSSLGILVAFPASSLLSRVYFSNGGKSKWIISWVAVAAWPIPALALIPTYILLKVSPTRPTLKLVISYIALGFLSAADNLMYAYGYAYLPASTASLLGSTSLIFSAFFGYLLVGNKITASVINAVILITAAMAIIALDSDSETYGGVTQAQYAMGFVWNVAGSALHGLIFALSELVFVKLLGRRSFHVVLEQQAAVSFFGFVFTSVGVAANDDFSGMVREARVFRGGKGSYVSVLAWGALSFQLGVLGGTGVLFLASTVLAGVLNSIRVPLTSFAAVAILKDPMSGFKILSLVITFWGFSSYVYGNYPKGNKTSS